jgi:hypothetical protein
MYDFSNGFPTEALRIPEARATRLKQKNRLLNQLENLLVQGEAVNRQ